MASKSFKNIYPFKKWHNWKYKNTALLIISVIVFVFLADTPFVKNIIQQAGSLGYLGAFIVGIFFVSTFTVAPASVILFRLADTLDPIVVALIAGLGAMTGDFFIFKFMKDKVFEELMPLFRKLRTPKIEVVFKSPYFAWILPVIGAFIIASPLPDEAGVSMLGLSKIKKWQFFLVTFLLNAAGIFIIVTIARLQ